MKKMIWALLAALCLLWPAGSLAQGLPGFEQVIGAAVEASAQMDVTSLAGRRNAPAAKALDEAQEDAPEADEPQQVTEQQAAMTEETDAPQGEQEPEEQETEATDAPETDAQQVAAQEVAAQAPETQAVTVVDEDLTLTIETAADKLNENQSVTLTVTASNPRAIDTPVTLTLAVPERLACAQATTWEAVLPAAEADEHGAVIPSVTTFTRELSLGEGGVGEQVALVAEMSMGTRFYRAQTELELCVSDISVATVAQGTDDGRVQPGQAFSYHIDVSNYGTAARDVTVEMVLPEGVSFAGELPEGFEQNDRIVSGMVHAGAAMNRAGVTVASHKSVDIPVSVDSDALEGDDDAMRLLSGALSVDGERVSMPRVQVCGAQITARLVPEADSLEAGAQMNLRIVVANAGLAPADVRVSCLLPEGLKVVEHEETATPGEAAAAIPPEDGSSAQAAVMLTEEAEMPVVELTPENGTLIYSVHMDAAQESADGITASTRVITVRVEADKSQNALKEKLVGAALAFTTDDDTQLAQAVAVRVYTPSFMGITRDEWGGIFWAAVLLVVTVTCLYAAVKADSDETDYCFD